MKGAYQSAGADTPADDRLRQYRALVRMRGHAPRRGPHLVRVLEMTDMVFQGRSREGVNSDTERGLVASRQGGRRQARHSLALRAPQQCSVRQPARLTGQIVLAGSRRVLVPAAHREGACMGAQWVGGHKMGWDPTQGCYKAQ